ncbi:hypothetical protein L6R53_09170 [Myxococcota bacterium]|nr:hypothetical protein [Myxococcota bacterium]
MPVLGAVAHISPAPGLRLQALAALAATPGLTFGELAQDRLPLVLEVADRADGDRRWQALAGTPGVLHLELAYADFSDLVEPT